MGTVVQDLRYAARKLAHSPGFTLVAVLTLAVGIGATTAIFSVVNGALLRPLPYPDPGRIVVASEIGREGEVMPVAGPNFQDWRSWATRSFNGMAVYASGRATVLGAAEPVRPEVAEVSGDFFQVLRTSPFSGRLFNPDEVVPGGAPVAVVSHEFWQSYMGGTRDFVDRPLQIYGTSYTVVGVMPPGFRFPSQSSVWIPETLAQPGSRNAHRWSVVGRLRPGVPIAEARAQLNDLQGRIVQEHGTDVNGVGVRLVTLQEEMTGSQRTPLLLLLGAAGLVLLIACANLASTLLARGAARRQEIAVRSALGASRGRLTRQLFTEGLLLSAMGAAAGLGIAFLFLRLLMGFAAGRALVPVEDVGLDAAVLAFTLLAAVLAAILFGLFPALRLSGTELGRDLAGSRSVADRGRGATWSILVGAEVALSLVLLVGAGLLIRSFVELRAVDLGYRTDGVLTVDLALPETTYPDDEALAALHRSLLPQVEALPGVEAVGLVNIPPLAGFSINGAFQVEGREPRSGFADYRVASDGYFAAMGIPLLSGRTFDATLDHAGTDDVAVVTRLMAERHWPGEEAVGKRFRNLANDNWVYGDRWITVIGVVGDVRHSGPTAEPTAEVYVNYLQRPFRSRYATLAIQGSVPPSTLVSTVRATLASHAPDVPADFRTMEERITQTVGDRRFTTTVLSLFAGVALFLAAVGIYGVISYQVVQRTREIGIRMALGAAPGMVRSMVIRGSMLVVASGLVAGAVGAVLLSRAIQSLLFGVRATDPGTFALVVLVLAAVALAASAVPAVRATRVDPTVALRSD